MTRQISQGLLLTGELASPFHLSASVRDPLLQVTADLWHHLVAGVAATYIDAVRNGHPVAPDVARSVARSVNLLAGVRGHVLERVKHAIADVRRHPSHDLSLSLKVLAHPDRPDALLCIVNAEQRAYFDALLAMGGVEDFSYWPAEFPPDGVTRAQWDTRDEVWSRALHGGYTTELGWSWNLLREYVELSLPERGNGEPGAVLAALPSDADRARALALSMARPDLAFTRDNFMDLLDQQREKAATLHRSALELLAPITAADLLASTAT